MKNRKWLNLLSEIISSLFVCMCVFSTYRTRGWGQIKPIVQTPVQTCRASRERKTELEIGQYVCCIPITQQKSYAPHLSKHLTHTHTHTWVECSTGAKQGEFSSLENKQLQLKAQTCSKDKLRSLQELQHGAVLSLRSDLTRFTFNFFQSVNVIYDCGRSTRSGSSGYHNLHLTSQILRTMSCVWVWNTLMSEP